MAEKKNKALLFIFITLLIDVIGIGIIIPVVPALIEKLTGEGISVAAMYGGWLTFAYAVFQFLFAPVLGALSDRFGRRPVLLFSLFGLGLDYIFQAFAPTVFWLFIGRIIAGITGASFTTATAYIADISAPEKRAQNFGMVGAAFGLGFIIGPLVGGFASTLGTHVPFITAAGLSLINFIYGYFVLPESLPMKSRRRFDWSRVVPWGAMSQLGKYPLVLGLIGSFVLLMIASHSVQSNWVFYTEYRFHWTGKAVGLSLAFVGLMIAIVQGGLMRFIMPKLGQNNAIYLGLFLNMLSLILFGLANRDWMMYAILFPYAFAGIAGPAMQGLMSSEVPANEQGELQGGLTALMSLTSMVGPLIMNSLFAYCTMESSPFLFPAAPFMLGAAMVLAALLLAYNTLSKTVKK